MELLKLLMPLPEPLPRPLSSSFSRASMRAALASSRSRCTMRLVMLPIDCSAGCESCRWRPAALMMSMSSCMDEYLADDTTLRSVLAVASDTASGPVIWPRRSCSDSAISSFCDDFSLMMVSNGAWCASLGVGSPAPARVVEAVIAADVLVSRDAQEEVVVQGD